MSAAKEYYLMCYENAVEDLCEAHGIEFLEAEEMLLKILDEDPDYLDGYLAYDEN
jgi:hypothetical protein